MNTLVMDTSNQYLVVALYHDNQLLEAKQIQALKQQSELAIPFIDELLKKHSLKLKNIDQMVITKGPGSYTGVRIAMTIAKTLATVLPIRIKTVSSLAALAGNSKAISILDARSQKLYVGMYENAKPLIDECLMTIEEFRNFCKEHSDFMIVGDTSIIGIESQPICIYENIFALSMNLEPVEDVDCLVPTYIKGVEAKRQ